MVSPRWHPCTWVTEASEIIGKVVGRSDRTVREWRAVFTDNCGEFPNTLQGKYQHDGVLWQNEDLNKAAVKYVRENSVVKGRPNLTATSFCQWINECLLPNQILEPGYLAESVLKQLVSGFLSWGSVLWSTRRDHT